MMLQWSEVAKAKFDVFGLRRALAMSTLDLVLCQCSCSSSACFSTIAVRCTGDILLGSVANVSYHDFAHVAVGGGNLFEIIYAG